MLVLPFRVVVPATVNAPPKLVVPDVTLRPEPKMPTPLMFKLPVCWVPGVVAWRLMYDPLEPMLVGVQTVPFHINDWDVSGAIVTPYIVKLALPARELT
jgi:hypothetical protein